MKISLFIACYNDILFPATGKAVVSVLERLGHSVEFRAEQTCCGQMHYNTGYQGEALNLMRRFVDIFRGAETICVPSASCVAMMRDHYPKMARGDDGLKKDVEKILERTFEFSELLVDKLQVEDVGGYFPHRVALHPSCHSLRSLRVGDKPLRLLKAVREIELVGIADEDQCCGFGGTFAIKNGEVSAEILAEKLQNIAKSGAEVCTAVDNSCLLHIFGGLSRANSAVKCMHLAEILASRQEEGAA